MGNDVEVSIIIPTRDGGALLRRVVESIFAQRTSRSFEVVVVDSGSSAQELEWLTARGATVERVDPRDFDHGRTRDLGAALSRGKALVFLNQDAQPVGDRWLEGLTEPIFAADAPDAIQGAIAEFPEEELNRSGRSRFYWGTGGPRFYFTRESEDWISAHRGVGFSTVHCALRREAWESVPFGEAPILEDKKWQIAAESAGMRIEAVPAEQALVWHSHQYDLRALWRRCVSEGFGWRMVGVSYRAATAVADAFTGRIWREWWSAVRSPDRLSVAEIVFPLLRPVAVWWGNHLARSVLH